MNGSRLFREKLRFAREHRKMSIQLLAMKSGVSVRKIVWIERGIRKASLDEADRLCKALCMSYTIGQGEPTGESVRKYG